MADEGSNQGEGLEFSVNEVAAIALHELFETLVRVGFTERQALIYLAEMVKRPGE